MEKRARLYLKTPEQKWLLRGGLAACALPVMCSFTLMFLSFLVTNDAPTQGAIYANFADIDFVLAVPIIGSLLAAFLGIREIRKKVLYGFSGKGSFIWITLKAGFFAHWIIAFLLFLLIMFLDYEAMGLIYLIKFIIAGTFVTLVFWGAVTLPVSLACGFIFWFVAVRGAPNMMADIFD